MTIIVTVCDRFIAEAFSGTTVQMTKLVSLRSVKRDPTTERTVCRALLWLTG